MSFFLIGMTNRFFQTLKFYPAGFYGREIYGKFAIYFLFSRCSSFHWSLLNYSVNFDYICKLFLVESQKNLIPASTIVPWKASRSIYRSRPLTWALIHESHHEIHTLQINVIITMISCQLLIQPCVRLCSYPVWLDRIKNITITNKKPGFISGRCCASS